MKKKNSSNNRFYDGKVVAITGAGSGIGQALAIDLASRGASLALSDVNSVGLAETAAKAEGFGAKVSTAVVDVADRDAVFAWADEAVGIHGKVNIIINNAGVALVAPVAAMEFEDFTWLMNINFWGVVNGTQAFLPHLKATGAGHVVNISSVFGLQAIPSQSAYNAAKFAVRGFTDALRMELEMEPCGVSATTIHPGGIKTNIVKSARYDASVIANDKPGRDRAKEFDQVAFTSPERAAKQILKAVERDRRRALIGPDAKLFDGVSRLPARFGQAIVRAGAKRQA